MIKYILINIISTVLRLFPLPQKTGLIKIGNPKRNSPVLLTCNYRLTTERLKKKLKGLNLYLLVANSRGINVWCAATGGHLSHHDVISAIKVSGIEDITDTRTVILPQLAAAGVESRQIKKKTGWNVVWGPVYAKDIPDFLENNLKKTNEMRRVKFPISDRFEMAVAWAFPISVIAALIFSFFWIEVVLPLTIVIWGLSLLIFLLFPLYESLLKTEGKRVAFILFDFGSGGIQLIFWGLFIAGLFAYSIFWSTFSWAFILRWGLISLVIILILSLDLTGSTPVFKSGTHEDRLLTVVLDEKKCRGIGHCEEVCPRNCFEVDKTMRTAKTPGISNCVRCGACIVQCPLDAIYFKNPEGDIILPDTIRKFKLNIMGKRLVKL
jgi:NAD-dependent dihydropyrimidine dehydrogenase PreA subunit